MKQTILFILLSIFLASAQAKIYKWTDDKGNTHFSSQMPRNYDSKKINPKMNSSIETKKKNSQYSSKNRSVDNYDPDSNIALKMMQDVYKSYGVEKVSKLNCRLATSQIKAQMKDTVKFLDQGLYDQKINRQEYLKKLESLKEAKADVTLEACNNARGKKNRFFLCMSAPNSHISNCGKQYRVE